MWVVCVGFDRDHYFVLIVTIVEACMRMVLALSVGRGSASWLEIVGCDSCDFNGPLKLVYAFNSKYTPNKLNTTYKCPECHTPYWDEEPIVSTSDLR